MRRVDLIGISFGRLTVTAFSGARHGHSCWECDCTCGGKAIVSSNRLRHKTQPTRSCGCLVAEQSSINGKGNLRHGEGGKTAEYEAWTSMRARCSNPNHHAWEYYGGAGVAVCDRWLNSYQDFLSDMGRRPTSKHSLDRFPNPYGSYEPTNCRWATASQQNKNRRPFKRNRKHAEV